MNKKIMKQWVKALRSGEFKQTKGCLEDKNGNCCLGVLCTLALVEGVCDYSVTQYGAASFDDRGGTLPHSVRRWAGMKTPVGAFRAWQDNFLLTAMNDNGKNFNYIADMIEKHWEKL